MTNFIAVLFLIICLSAFTDAICRSLDCNGGNKAACELVAKRYEAH